MTTGKVPAAGGVVVDRDGRLLLVEPRRHFGGYVWTFPKGRPDAGESLEDAAVREVREETGVTARIVTSEHGIPVSIGVYEGDVTQTRYYLMQKVAEGAEFDAETQSIRWAPPAVAASLIGQTTNANGRARDTAVLKDAVALLALVGVPK